MIYSTYIHLTRNPHPTLSITRYYDPYPHFFQDLITGLYVTAARRRWLPLLYAFIIPTIVVGESIGIENGSRIYAITSFRLQLRSRGIRRLKVAYMKLVQPLRRD